MLLRQVRWGLTLPIIFKHLVCFGLGPHGGRLITVLELTNKRDLGGIVSSRFLCRVFLRIQVRCNCDNCMVQRVLIAGRVRPTHDHWCGLLLDPVRPLSDVSTGFLAVIQRKLVFLIFKSCFLKFANLVLFQTCLESLIWLIPMGVRFSQNSLKTLFCLINRCLRVGAL